MKNVFLLQADSRHRMARSNDVDFVFGAKQICKMYFGLKYILIDWWVGIRLVYALKLDRWDLIKKNVFSPFFLLDLLITILLLPTTTVWLDRPENIKGIYLKASKSKRIDKLPFFTLNIFKAKSCKQSLSIFYRDR